MSCLEGEASSRSLSLRTLLLGSALGVVALASLHHRAVHAQEPAEPLVNDDRERDDKQEEEKGQEQEQEQTEAKSKETETETETEKEEETKEQEEKQSYGFVHYLLNQPILLLLLDEEDMDEKIEGQLDAIIADEELKAVHLLDFGLFSQNREDFPPDANALIYNFNKETREIEAYIYPADMELTPENVKQFLADVRDHKIGHLRFHPSERRPPNDRHPQVKNLKIVTTESFKELVLDSDSDVLVYVRLPSSPTPKDLQILARALGNDEDLVVAECKSFLNELDPLYFGDTPAEGIKLFRKGHKSEPVTYHGKGNPFEIAFFLSLQRGENGEEAYRRLRSVDVSGLIRNLESVLGKYYMHSISHKEFVPPSPKATALFKELFDLHSELGTSSDPIKQKITNLKKELKAEIKKLEHIGMKNLRIVEKDKYEEELEEARKKGKVVVFFWRKGCWPCKKLTPMVGKLSEDFPDYSFLKVDADVEGLAATPTFYIFDNEDEKAKQLSGMKLLTFFHDQAQQRGLSGYAHWLPPSERAKLEKHEDQEPKENKEANRSMESAGNNSTEP